MSLFEVVLARNGAAHAPRSSWRCLRWPQGGLCRQRRRVLHTGDTVSMLSRLALDVVEHTSTSCVCVCVLFPPWAHPPVTPVREGEGVDSLHSGTVPIVCPVPDACPLTLDPSGREGAQRGAHPKPSKNAKRRPLRAGSRRAYQGVPFPQRPCTAGSGAQAAPGLDSEDTPGRTRDTRVAARRSSELPAAQGRNLTPELVD